MKCFFIVDAGRRTELFLVVDEVGVCCVLKTEMDKKKQSSNRISDIFYEITKPYVIRSYSILSKC